MGYENIGCVNYEDCKSMVNRSVDNKGYECEECSKLYCIPCVECGEEYILKVEGRFLCKSCRGEASPIHWPTPNQDKFIEWIIKTYVPGESIESLRTKHQDAKKAQDEEEKALLGMLDEAEEDFKNKKKKRTKLSEEEGEGETV